MRPRPAPLRTARRWWPGGAFAALLTGSVVAQALTLAMRPILARLYPPEAFGLAGTFAAIAALAALPATGAYEEAALLPENHDDAGALLRLSAILAGVAAAVVAALLPFRAALARASGAPELAPLLLLLPVAMLALAWGRVGENALLRLRQFRAAATRKTATAATLATLQGVGGWTFGTGFALAAAQTAAQTLSLAFYAPARLLLRRPPQRRTRALARQYRSFPFAAVPNSVFNTLAVQLPTFVLLKRHGATATGLYVAAAGLLAAPVGLVANAAAQAYVVHAAEYRRNGTLAGESEVLFARLLRAGLLPLLGLTFVGPAVFGLILGPQWTEAGTLAAWLAPWQLAVLASSPLSRLFDVLQRQGLELSYNLLLFAARLAALVWGSQWNGASGAVAAFGMVSVAFWTAHAVLVLRMAGVPSRRILHTVSHTVVHALPGLFAVALAAWSLPPRPAGLVYLLAVALHGLLLARTLRPSR